MIFSLDIQRAHKGDCLILHYGDDDEPGLAFIDGGPAGTYFPHLKKRIEAIRAARELEDNESLPVDLLMVSHIDDDHINGILEMTNELLIAKKEKRPLMVKVTNFWHNTFDNIIGNDPAKLLSSITAAYGPASLTGDPDVEGLEPETAQVLASVKQGFQLRNDAKGLGYTNTTKGKFPGKLILAVEGGKDLDMGKGLMFRVAGPMQKELEKLQKDHDKYLEKHGTPEAALAAFTDTSVANLSSIVVIARFEGKSMLLTGDARGDKILKGLELINELEDGKLHVDLLKMPHHGSSRNMEQEFLENITADHYVFSGDGEHGNPERETLEMLMNARGDADYTIYFTYPVAEIDVEREKDWNKERNKEIKRGKVDVREEWSHEEHSLEAFFNDNPDMKARLVVAGKQGHVINLLGKLPF